MAEREVVETSEAQIAVHWQEEGYYYPSAKFIAQANMTDESIYERFSLDNFPNCYKEYADLLDWYEYWHTILDTSDAPCWKWFVGGKINASYNCIDRHLPKNKNKTAIHFVPELENEKVEHITYQALYVRVNEFTALLRDFAGLKAGDRVTLHMPMTAELPITMLACARLGVIHSQVFGGFSGKAAADRVIDPGSRVLITMDAYYRGGALGDHADIGWITGHSYIVYGPLALCASTVIFEGIPTYPDAGRCWRIAQNLDVNIFHTAPTAIRALRKVGPDEPAKYNYEFKHMTTVGEPIEPAVWKWHHKEVGKGKAIIVDTWWQTETGGFLCSTLPALKPMKPGSAGPGMPGIHPIIYDEDGKVLPQGAGKAGNIIFVSAMRREVDIAKGLALGADAYITKPFANAEIIQKVRGVLGH